MPKSRDDSKLNPQDTQSVEKSTAYTKPRLESLGRIRDLTRMPGGSMNTEGSSGKPHKQ